MTTTRSPAEAFGQRAEAISNQGKPMRFMDTAARLAPLVGLGVLGFAQGRRDARDARQFYDALEQNYAFLDAREQAEALERARYPQELLRAVRTAGRPANHNWRVGMVAGAASVQSRNRPPLTGYQRGARQDERFELYNNNK